MDAYPVGLPEPFKVRVITKGATHHYHLARRWQPRMWEPLKNHPTFELVGKPLDQQTMNRFLGLCGIDDGREFTSGDYASATDHLDSELSLDCLDAICECIGVPFEDRIVLKEALVNHIFHIKDGAGGVETMTQEKGQLMGSPISFPILCIFNAALTRYALEVASPLKVRYMLDDLPMLINGDDIVFRTSVIEYLTWKAIVAFGGLKPSVGKNFRSRNLGTINSEMWSFKTRTLYCSDPSLQPTRFITGKRRPIIEMGMLRGSMKNGTTHLSRDEQSPFSDPSRWGMSKQQCWEKFLSSCPNRPEAYKYLWSTVGLELSKTMPAGVPMCAPVWLGGGGFPLPAVDSTFYESRVPSAFQRLTCRYLSDTFSFGLGQKYVRSLEDVQRPANLAASMEVDQRLRRTLRVPKAKIAVDDDIIDQGFNSLPTHAFHLQGIVSSEGNARSESRGLHLRNKIVSKSIKHARSPLPVHEFRPVPPPLKLESYVFLEVVV
jgi:hypothetical protein